MKEIIPTEGLRSFIAGTVPNGSDPQSDDPAYIVSVQDAAQGPWTEPDRLTTATQDTDGRSVVIDSLGDGLLRISPHVVWQDWNVTRAERERRNGHRAAVLWFTGFSGAGKSTLARGVERHLFEAGCQTMLVEGDQIRHGLCGDLGFSPEDRAENIRRAGHVARLFLEQGSIVLCTFVSPTRQDRDAVRRLFGADEFFEIYVRCELETCRRRDPKGLYARADAGEIRNLTGISAPYEEPQHAEIVVDTTEAGPPELVRRILEALFARQVLAPAGPTSNGSTTSA